MAYVHRSLYIISSSQHRRNHRGYIKLALAITSSLSVTVLYRIVLAIHRATDRRNTRIRI